MGIWADKNTPGWLFNIFDIAERMHLSVRWTKHLIAKYKIPKSYLRRTVRLGPGVIRIRRLLVLTPSSFELLLAKHAGASIPQTSNKEVNTNEK